MKAAIAALLVLVACAKDPAPTPPPPPTPTPTPTPASSSKILFKQVRVFDGTAVIPSADVLIEAGVITKVEPVVDAPGATIVDGAGKTLVPGLIDAHAHVWDGAQLHQAAVFGVTTVLDMMTAPKVAAALKAEASTPAGRGRADLRSAMNPVTSPKGHGTEYGLPLRTITKPEDAAAFVAACVAEGSDYVKIIYDDGSAYGVTFETISKATMAAAVTAAHAAKKLAVAHIGSRRGALDAFEAGVDGLAHGFLDAPPGPEVVAAAVAHHAFVIPTLTVNASVAGVGKGGEVAANPAFAPYLSDDDRAGLTKGFPLHPRKTKLELAHALATVKALHDAHVPVLAGTDAPNPGTTYGASLHGELALLVAAGLTPADALAAATSAPATAFGLADRGRIAGGKRADLLLVDGDPTVDVAALAHVAGVWVNGVAIDRDAYRAEVTAAREAAARAPKPPVPAGSEAGLISDFDDGTPATRFGRGWKTSTDAMMGGSSTATMTVVAGGARGSKHALAIAGELATASGPASFAGAMFSPGDAPMAPVDLSAKKEISFWAKGDGRTYAVMLFAKSRGFQPAAQDFVAGKTWKQVTFPLKAFDGLDGHDLMGVFFGAATGAGKFELVLDQVELR